MKRRSFFGVVTGAIAASIGVGPQAASIPIVKSSSCDMFKMLPPPWELVSWDRLLLPDPGSSSVRFVASKFRFKWIRSDITQYIEATIAEGQEPFYVLWAEPNLNGHLPPSCF